MRKPSFTLVETIVVISIIALLMAIIVPVLEFSKERAKAIVCNSNIKQLVFSLFMYENENHTLPYGFYFDPNMPRPPGEYYAGYEHDRTGWWWFNFTEKYKRADGKRTIIQCPSKKLMDQKFDHDILCGNYGINRSICKSSDDRQGRREDVGKPLKTLEIPKPSQSLLIVDSGYAIINWWYATDSPPVSLRNFPIEDTAYVPGLSINKNRKLMPCQERDATYGRHPNKKVNVGFVDGHINLIQAEDLIVKKTEQGYKRKTPLWVPK